MASTTTALNEIVITKQGMYSIDFEIWISGQKMMNVNADGLLICSSCGSSAYNSSIRGPLMTPKSSNLILNFFAPFGTNCLPLVTSKDEEIEIRMNQSNWQNEVDLVVDSNDKVAVTKGQIIRVRLTESEKIRLITPSENVLKVWLQKVSDLMKWNK